MAISPFSALLPLYGMSITLRFTAKAEFTYFHQMTVDAFTRYLLDSPKDYQTTLTTESPESGRLHYTMDDTYRFTITSFAGQVHHFTPLFKMLNTLPNSAPVRDPQAPLRDNIKLVHLIDLNDGKPLTNVSGLNPFSVRQLIDVAHTWQNEKTTYPRTLHFQWLSPVRLLRTSHERTALNLTGEHRFCRDKTHLSPALLIRRIIETLNNLMTELGQQPTPFDQSIYDHLPLVMTEADLFWLDTPYYSKDKEDNTTGGLVGYITLEQQAPLPHGIWQGLILAQYLGVGQRRTSGFGKYQLSLNPDPHTHGLPIRLGRSQSLLDHALSKRTIDKAILLAEEKKDNHHLSDKQNAQLQSAFGQLRRQDYHVPPLFGQLIPKKDGSMRALAISPVYDRILQKAVSLTISPCIDAILYHRTYAYRKGHSRQQARFDIQQAWEEGYRWVYESDVEDFFDSIDRDQLIKRLISLFGDDPIMPVIANWLAAPVILNGQRIERPKGIPQGSPLSPVLANFILDDFDADLESRGFRLVRFADDFIILCKSRIEAELAADQVKNSLSELGLSINIEKSHIISLEQGFKFLGYMFQNEWAVDISGKTSDGTKTFNKDEAPEYMPAWLAALGDQQPKSIEAQRFEEAGNIGQIDDEGTFLTIAGESCMLSLDNKQVVIKRDEVVTHSLPLAHISGILLFGNHHLTTPLIKAALKAQVPIHLADRMGNYDGAIWKRQPIDNSYKGWFIQLQHFDNTEFALTLAKETVKSRLYNMQSVLQRHHKQPKVMTALKQIAKFSHKIQGCQEFSRLLGIEGVATREYYQGLAELIPDWCNFQGRNRRPPKDPFNVLLSFGYTWLYAHADAILTTLGFLTWKGYYHQTSSGHAALASDIIESYRHLIERTALTAVSIKVVQLDDFRYEDDQIRLGSEARKKYLTLLEKRFLKETDGQHLWQALHQQGQSLWGNINHHSSYLPFKEGKKATTAPQNPSTTSTTQEAR